jgi:hypothetical protein
MTNTLILPDDIAAIDEADTKELAHPDLSELLEVERSFMSARISTEAIAADCHTTYHAYHVSGTRPLSVINLIVMHATQGGTSRSVSKYFKMPTSGGSATMVVDDYSCYRCLRDDEIPWGAPGANYNGIHIEQCGYSSWLKSMWSTTHRKTLMRAAYKAAYHCKKYGLKPRFLTAANLKAGMRNGITTHAECTKAFGGDHTDPGTGWPRLLFMTLVRGYYTALKVRKVA